VTRLRVLALAGLAALVVAALAVAASPPDRAAAGTGAGRQLLPDLDVTYPYRLIVEEVELDGERRVLLSFASEAMNVGAGPLIVEGHRESLAEPTLVADQIVQLANGQTTTLPDVGHLEYVEDPTHEHFHLLPFMRYELRRASDFKLLSPDRKTGFCLGDRVDAFPNKTLPGEPDHPVYNTACGPDERDLLGLVEGISVGWADVYEPWRDGQYLDITGLPAGRYLVVHRVNPGRVLLESRYGNNAASALIRLSWPNGKQGAARVTVLAQCSQKARCST
jgi:hypothetical protein